MSDSSGSTVSDSSSTHNGVTPGPAAGFALAVGAIGVVFGDIGTSPLYTLKELFSSHYGLIDDTVRNSPELLKGTVLGVLSLVFWTLMMIVTLKYVTIAMRADNDGEGGIMALMALAQRILKNGSRSAYVVGILGIFGASLFFGDGVITPAITVMGAVEGLGVAEARLMPFVVPIAVVVLLAMFLAQRFGTEKVGRIFGPIMCAWFISLALVGIYNVVDSPGVLSAFNPWWGVQFFMSHGWAGIFIFGAVVLAVTGGEALYADMGHFGMRPIRHAWYFFILPCLSLNYMGQGARILGDSSAVSNPFYEAVPGWALYPMIVLATMAAVIASQSVISGAFSVARQAMQLGYIPRMQIVHTSKNTIGQIYIPAVNWLLMILVIALVVVLRDSGKLAVAYGLSVSATMLIDTVLLALVAYTLWPKWRMVVLPLCLVFFIIELVFVIANGNKLFQSLGAWFPVVLGVSLFFLMRTWRRGRRLLSDEIRKEGIAMDTFLKSLMLAPPVRVSGTAVFLTADASVVPHALMHNLKHNKVLHEKNVFLTVKTLPVPYVAKEKRMELAALGDGFYQLMVSFGFMETPDVPLALMQAGDKAHVRFDPMETTYFASRETIVASTHRGMPLWRDKLFAIMHRNATSATNFFRIPGNRLVELGTQVEI